MMSKTLAPDYAIKYPRTPHLPQSPGSTSDDKWASPETLAYLNSGIELVTTTKMDGGNLSWYRDFFHGRSLDSGTHAWDTQARALWAQVRHDIPEGWRISGESMYARRSVSYENLPGVFIVFGIWNEHNEALAWDEVEEWAGLLGLPTVPVLYRGTSFKDATEAWGKVHTDAESEGFVVRDAGRFPYAEFESHVVKWVREGHVRTNADWRHRDDFAINTFASPTI
jgi:hypothetical protein